ncbi:MAG: hypothetical protein H5U17_08885 [Defluviimonas sp.]|nr:hypothetical protein [Defluviimonas sp.]
MLFSPVANLTASSVALEQASAAPLRLPILLGRSIDDGPALWYLREACPTEPLAFCKAFGGRIPDNLHDLLFAPEGIGSLTEAQMAEIRAEEPLILWRAFKAYPRQQLASFLGNAGYQLVRIGVGDMHPSAGLDARMEPLLAGGCKARAVAQRRRNPLVSMHRARPGEIALVIAGACHTGCSDNLEKILGYLAKAAQFAHVTPYRPVLTDEFGALGNAGLRMIASATGNLPDRGRQAPDPVLPEKRGILPEKHGLRRKARSGPHPGHIPLPA